MGRGAETLMTPTNGAIVRGDELLRAAQYSTEHLGSKEFNFSMS